MTVQHNSCAACKVMTLIRVPSNLWALIERDLFLTVITGHQVINPLGAQSMPQAMGGKPSFSSSLLALEKCLQPKKPWPKPKVRS